MTDQWRNAAISAATTALSVLGLLLAILALDAPVDIPAAWVAWVTFAATVLRTALAWLNPAMPLYGKGSPDADN